MKKLTFLIAMFAPLFCMAEQDMAFVISKGVYCETAFCLQGTFRKGIDVVLLSKAKSKTCTAITAKSLMAKDEMLEFPVTTLEKHTGCTADNYFMALIDKKITKYKIAEETPLSKANLIKTNEQLISSETFNSNYESVKVRDLSKQVNSDNKFLSLDQIKKKKPIGYKYNFNKNDSLILISHSFGSGSSAGTWFAIFKNNISAVSGTFNLGAPFVFVVDNFIYVMTGTTCQLGCGENTYEIYKMIDNNFEGVLSNSDFST